jgi:hypothetical protein
MAQDLAHVVELDVLEPEALQEVQGVFEACGDQEPAICWEEPHEQAERGRIDHPPTEVAPLPC